MSSTIVLEKNDWLYNAGLVGFLNILRHSESSLATNEEYFKVSADGQRLEINEFNLEQFAEKYFEYMIYTYEKTLSWYEVVKFEGFIDKHIENNLETFTVDDLGTLNKYIGTSGKPKSLKYILASNSYLAAYKVIEDGDLIVQMEKEIVQIKFNEKEKSSINSKEVLEVLLKIKKLIGLFNKPENKKHIAAKNIIYNYIKLAWNGVSFLNSQSKILDIYEAYDSYFLNKAQEYLSIDKKSYKWKCFTCESPIKNTDNDLSFMNQIGFDKGKKSSHVWGHFNDIGLCPICKIVYSCVPAGMTYVFDKGIFINSNQSIETLYHTNYKIKSDLLKDESQKRKNTFKALIKSFSENMTKSAKYEKQDIQVIRCNYANDKINYKFNILSKTILNTLIKSQLALDKLTDNWLKEVDEYIYIYDEVVLKLFNNEQLFLLLQKMISIKLSKPDDAHYFVSSIQHVNNINFEYLKGIGLMQNYEKKDLKVYNSSGYYLRQAYIEKGSENKLNGISYRLLNALKTNNNGMFMDVILNCYLYVDKQVPSFLIDCMKETEIFKTIGYSFVAGLIDGDAKNANSGGTI